MSAVNLNRSEFQKLVIEEKKSAVIDFWAPWCSYCRRIGPAFEQVAQDHPEILAGKINIDDEPALTEQFGIEIIPTLLAFRDGKLAGSVVNPGSRAKIEEFLKEHLG